MLFIYEILNYNLYHNCINNNMYSNIYGMLGRYIIRTIFEFKSIGFFSVVT